jgi:hypothetical protein
LKNFEKSFQFEKALRHYSFSFVWDCFKEDKRSGNTGNNQCMKIASFHSRVKVAVLMATCSLASKYFFLFGNYVCVTGKALE